MNAIHIEAEVGRDHRLIEALPPEVPVGWVRLVIEPLTEPPRTAKQPLTREEARRRLLAAGALSTDHRAPEGTIALSDEELQRLGQALPRATPLDRLIDDDRGPHE